MNYFISYTINNGKKIFNLNVDFDYNDSRIDKFLQLKFTDLSRTKIQKLIHEEFVKVNNKIICETSKEVKTQDKIEISFPNPKETNIKSTKMHLDILHEDDDIIMLNKAPGVVVHPVLETSKEKLL